MSTNKNNCPPSNMKIQVRQYKPDYAEVHYLAVKASIESLKRWFHWATPTYSLCDSVKFINERPHKQKTVEGEKFVYAIFDSTDGEFMGSCGVTIKTDPNGTKSAILSYWRRSDTYKSHIISETIDRLKRKLSNRGISRMEMDIADCNKGSIKTAERAGAKAKCEKPIPSGNGEVYPGKTYVLPISATTKTSKTKRKDD